MKLFSFFWQRLAGLFDPVQYFFNGDFWEVFKEKFGSFNEEKVLDLACGTGELGVYIKPRKYLGVDINKSYIKYAKKRFCDKNIKFVVGDILVFVVPRGFNTVFLISAAHHFSNAEMRRLCSNLARYKFKTFVIVDGIPQGIFSGILAWLDGTLAGGKYFRTERQLEAIISRYFVVKESGTLHAKRSFYQYPYIVACR